jgi:hypothetical protein
MRRLITENSSFILLFAGQLFVQINYMQADKPLVDKDFLLEKFPGKGGWTYAVIREIPPARNAHFGWVKVSGSIDGFPLKNYRLMPMGKGVLFLPVRAEIRKRIGKEAGDSVRIILFLEDTIPEVSGEIMDCFETEPPKALETFLALTEEERKAYLDWIGEARREETKTERIAKMMDQLMLGRKFSGPANAEK